MQDQQKRLYGEIPVSYKQGSIRFLLLLLIVLVAFANEYSFNNPQALEDALREHLHISQTQFQLFYALYSLPNVFTLLLIGYALDKIGMRIGIVILAGGIALCQLMFAFGGYFQNYPVMLVARILFGIASRGLFIPQTALVSFWFKGKQLSFAMGIVITFPQLGNALNSYLTPLIYEASGQLGAPLLASVGLCFLGFLGALVVYRIDRIAEQTDIQNEVQSEISELSLEKKDSKHEAIKCSDLKELSNAFWIMSVLCTFTMAQYIPFLDNANMLFQTRFCFSRTSAGKMVTITYLATALFSGPLGLLVNYIGFRRYFIVAATVIFLTAHSIIWAYPQCSDTSLYAPAWGLLLLGLGYSFYANVIVASIPLVVKKKVLGSAIAIMQILSSLTQCVVPIITGYLIDTSTDSASGYQLSSFFFIILGFIAFFCSIMLFFIDIKFKKRLDIGSMKKFNRPQSFDNFNVPTQYSKIEDSSTSTEPQSPRSVLKSTVANYLRNKKSSIFIELTPAQLF